jgi:hypothetical protein
MEAYTWGGRPVLIRFRESFLIVCHSPPVTKLAVSGERSVVGKMRGTLRRPREEIQAEGKGPGENPRLGSMIKFAHEQ